MQVVKRTTLPFRRCVGAGRSISMASVLSVNHYEVLGLTRSATVADIKAAYYKKSKECHPDLNMETEAAEQFRAITEAYEVLGNAHSKRLYDKKDESKHFHVPETPEEKFQKSRQHIVPTDGYKKIYDFDAWTKAHYSQAVREKAKINVIKRQLREIHETERKGTGLETGIMALVFCIGVFIAALEFTQTDMDKVQTNNKKKNEK